MSRDGVASRCALARTIESVQPVGRDCEIAQTPMNRIVVGQASCLSAGLSDPVFFAGKISGARLAEGVFVIENPPWDDAWRVVIGLHRDLVPPVPQLSPLLHLAAAQLTGASHYLSLGPPARQLARKLGFHVLPGNL